MTGVMELIEHPALWFVALSTLLHELGAPVPLTLTVLIAGAGSVGGGADPLALVAVVAIATVAGNSAWFAAGRRYGARILKLLCRISLSPDSCVCRSENWFDRWGGSSVVIGRFVPGISLVVPPLAGALGMSWIRFILLTALGAALWALAVVGAGMLLHAQLDAAAQTFETYGRETSIGAVLLLALYVGWRAWRRRAAKAPAPRVMVTAFKFMPVRPPTH